MSRNFVISLVFTCGVSSSAFAVGIPSSDTSMLELGAAYQPALSLIAAEGEGSERTRTQSGTRASKAPAPAGSSQMADEDDDNARNPALPDSERGAGQETGGPARMRIPN